MLLNCHVIEVFDILIVPKAGFNELFECFFPRFGVIDAVIVRMTQFAGCFNQPERIEKDSASPDDLLGPFWQTSILQWLHN